MFFENNFRPLRITKLGERAGFLTGYYEPIVDGSRFPTGFKVPIYAGRGIWCGRSRPPVPAFLIEDSRYVGRVAANWCPTTIAARSSTVPLMASILRSAGSRIRWTRS